MTTPHLRVLFIPQWYLSRDGGKGALGTFCREHVQAASLYDETAVLFCTARARRWPGMNWEEVDDCGVRTFYATYGHSPFPKTTLPFFRLHLRRAIRRVIREWGKPDVIHTQDLYAYFVIKAAQGLGIPFVISQHWNGLTSDRKLDRRMVRKYQWAFAHSARVLPANKYSAGAYKNYGLEASVSWLPNALDTRVFYPPLQRPSVPSILHVSGFTAPKRLPDIIRAFARVRAVRPQAVLEIIGEGRERARVEALAASELPAGSFRFHGFLSKPEVAEHMRRACGFVLPSEIETFGCVLMEAMACACPVLTTRVGGIPAVVRDGEGLFVEVGNIEQIAQGMLQLVDNAHGLDMERISRETRERFSHKAVGRILHEEHLRAVEVS